MLRDNICEDDFLDIDIALGFLVLPVFAGGQRSGLFESLVQILGEKMEPIWLKLLFIFISFILTHGEEPSSLESETVDVADILALEEFGNSTIEGSGEDENIFEMPQDLGEPVGDANGESDR